MAGLQDYRGLQNFALTRKRYEGHSYEIFSWWRSLPVKGNRYLIARALSMDEGKTVP